MHELTASNKLPTRPEAAEHLTVSLRVLDELAAKKAIRFCKIGRSVRYRLQSLPGSPFPTGFPSVSITRSAPENPKMRNLYAISDCRVARELPVLGAIERISAHFDDSPSGQEKSPKPFI
jgi:hypothetical protein